MSDDGQHSGPQRAVRGPVFVEEHMFRLVDIAAPAQGRTPSPDTRADSLVTFGRDPGLATFTSALEDGKQHVTLELWPAEPPPPEGDWVAGLALRVTVGGGQLRLASGISSLGSPHELDVSPGTYVLGVWCRGRDAAWTAFLTWLDDEEEDEEQGDGEASVQRAFDGVEQWLLRLWPAG